MTVVQTNWVEMDGKAWEMCGGKNSVTKYIQVNKKLGHGTKGRRDAEGEVVEN